MNMPPIVLVHGLGSSFDNNWRLTGWADILAAEGREVVGFDLPGHGAAPRRDATSESPVTLLAARLREFGQPVDLVGFSAGARLSLATVGEHPDLIRRAVVMGIGDSMVQPLDDSHLALADAIEHDGGENASAMTRMLRQIITKSGNNHADVAAYVRFQHEPPNLALVAEADVPVLVVLGEDDGVAPADRIMATLRDGRLLMLPRTDHYATVTSFAAQDAVLSFLQE